MVYISYTFYGLTPLTVLHLTLLPLTVLRSYHTNIQL
jgi:hypothetical protein